MKGAVGGPQGGAGQYAQQQHGQQQHEQQHQTPQQQQRRSPADPPAFRWGQASPSEAPRPAQQQPPAQETPDQKRSRLLRWAREMMGRGEQQIQVGRAPSPEDTGRANQATPEQLQRMRQFQGMRQSLPPPPPRPADAPEAFRPPQQPTRKQS